MTKLLQVTTVASTLRAFLLPFAAHFRSMGWQVDAAAHGVDRCEECMVAFDQVWELPWQRSPLAPGNLQCVSRLRSIVREQHYDIIHVHTPVAGFVTRYALRHMRDSLQIVYTAHGFHFHSAGDQLHNAFYLSLEKAASRWTDYLAVINSDDEKAAISHELVNPEHLWVTPGIGLDLDYYNASCIDDSIVEALRRELGLRPSDFLVSMIAEFTPNKRHQDVVRALSKLTSERFHIAFAGKGPLEQDVADLARSLDILDRVHFLGFCRDVRSLLKASQAFILPSVREGLPRSAMEALSMGTPVIGTDIRGLRDLLLPDCGLLVPVGDPDGIAVAIRWVHENPGEVAAMVRRGLIQIRNHALPRILSMYESLYKQALDVDP